MMFYQILVALVGLMSISQAQVSALEPQQLAQEVTRIFEAKCADCHGAHLPKPKGKFGYVLDLARVGQNPEYVKERDPMGSELYQMVLHNEMPGEDADVPALTPAELRVVEQWILAGAPGVQAGSQPPPPQAGAAEPTKDISLPRQVLSWLGKFHPPSTHFPVGLLLAAALAELAAWWVSVSRSSLIEAVGSLLGIKSGGWVPIIRFLVVLGALSSVPTATLGWLADYPTVAGSQLALVYQIHRILGTFTAVWALVCAVLICRAECADGSPERAKFRGALLLGAALVSVTGFLGGALTFGGLDHYAF